LLVTIDGSDGIGKSSLASWLAWQLGMPAIQLDLYLISLDPPIEWRTEDLKRVVDQRIDRRRPVIVDGVCALDALDQIGRQPDFLVFVRGVGSMTLATAIEAYQSRQRPSERSNFVIDGYAE
jgi:hypothetical protein